MTTIMTLKQYERDAFLHDLLLITLFVVIGIIIGFIVGYNVGAHSAACCGITFEQAYGVAP